MIQAQTLFDQVKNTAPFIFDHVHHSHMRFIEILKGKPEEEGVSFYEFCIAAHFATVGTFVPTDVDNAIREKLWKKIHTAQDFLPMWKLVEEFLTWDESLVSKRWVMSPHGKKLSGHQGEWFTIAVPAYATALKVAQDYVPEIRGAIEKLVKEHEEALKELREAFVEHVSDAHAIKYARAYLDGIAAVAHNLGDLNRMIDAWELGDLDVLKKRVYKTEKPEFVLSAKIYQEMLASENHRHFPLREPKCIRQLGEYLLNYGPFLDDWGIHLVKSFQAGKLSEGELREVAEALIMGWKRLNPKSIYTSQGYSRALAGMEKTFPRGRPDFENLLSPLLKKEMNEGGLRTLMNVSRTQFEKQWVGKLYRMIGSESSD